MDPIWVHPERMSGTPCFTGTRVPVQNLFDSLARRGSVELFLEDVPTVKREQVVEVLRLAAEAVIPPAQRPLLVAGARAS